MLVYYNLNEVICLKGNFKCLRVISGKEYSEYETELEVFNETNRFMTRPSSRVTLTSPSSVPSAFFATLVGSLIHSTQVRIDDSVYSFSQEIFIFINTTLEYIIKSQLFKPGRTV